MPKHPIVEWRNAKWKVSALKDHPHNPRQFTEKGMADLRDSIRNCGYVEPIAINTTGTILSGHARKKILMEAGLKEVDVRVPDRELTEKEEREVLLRMNKNTAGEFNFEILANEFEIEELKEVGFTDFDLKLVEFTPTEKKEPNVTLAERFLVPPFSVLDARQGYWQSRKRAWLALGIQSELGRGGASSASGKRTGNYAVR